MSNNTQKEEDRHAGARVQPSKIQQILRMHLSQCPYWMLIAKGWAKEHDTVRETLEGHQKDDEKDTEGHQKAK